MLGVKLREAGDLGLVFLLIRRVFDQGVEGLGRHVDRVRGGVVGEAEVRNVLVKLGHHFGDCGLFGRRISPLPRGGIAGESAVAAVVACSSAIESESSS